MSNMNWIPVEEKYPDTDNYILLSLSNFSIPIVGRYEEDEDGGAFYAGDEDETLVSQDMFVNAWMPLVKPYRPDEEESVRTNGDRIRSMSDEELAAAMLELGVDACEKIPFCVNSDKCNEIMDAGELIPSDLCRKCLIKWLKS